MDRRQGNLTTNSLDTTAVATVSISNTSKRHPRQYHAHVAQNILLVWLDSNIDLVNDRESIAMISRFKKIVNNINAFKDADECIRFLRDTKEHQMFMIASGSLGEITVPVVHDLPQLNTIYIFCGNQARHEQWAKRWPKIKGVVTDILPICKALKRAVFDYNQNLISISFINHLTTRQNLKQLDSLFVITKVIKEIVLTSNFQEQHFNDFITYCRDLFARSPDELQAVDKLEHEYRRHPPIWWYTHQNFLYSMLNRSLQMMEIDVIINMGFFIRDLHDNIAALHQEQYVERAHSKSFIVYHGQHFSRANMNKLIKTQNGFISFNNFLSANPDRTLSLSFIRQAKDYDLIGVFFVIKLDPSIASTCFANLGEASYSEEDEVLFSMHSIFRIDEIQEMENDQVWQVDLTLTNDDNALTEDILSETYSNLEGWDRLGMLLIKLEDFNKAQDLYNILLDKTTTDRKKAEIYEHLGLIKENQGVHADAISYYTQSNKILQKILPTTDMQMASAYSNIAFAYGKMGDYSNALSYHKKALEIDENMLPSNHPDLASSYNNIGFVYDNMGDYSNALSYHQKALNIYEKTLSSTHPDLAASNNNIGWVYRNMGDYVKALSFYERALAILERSLSVDHPNVRDVRKSIDIVKKKI
ncbi:unnamed protein product [Rotaria socialis]|uniref:Uncharacterized protein n=1 Tax=Rotaria socialis TaxID=392032 RepID=A0A817NR44_9BILA|nr:unnamed protein product [Rotaria socialis]CAF3530050.1 unnamed protein product [Rotaria socialis]CAF4152960.1 unnamed protein product [Rotaria socialis]CAF4505999.1 unnamed protein product [Rotaria socialis]